MSLFSILQSLGLMVRVVPILEEGGKYISDDQALYVKGSVKRKRRPRHYIHIESSDSMEQISLHHFSMTGKRVISSDRRRNEETDFYLNYYHFFEDFKNSRDLESHWKVLLMARYPRGLPKTGGTYVGHALHPYRVVDAGGEDEQGDEVCNLDDYHEIFTTINTDVRIGRATILGFPFPTRHNLAFPTKT